MIDRRDKSTGFYNKCTQNASEIKLTIESKGALVLYMVGTI